MDHFGPDESALEIRVDHPSAFWRLCTGPKGPSPRLLFTGGEEGTQPQEMECGLSEPGQDSLTQTQTLEQFGLLGDGKLRRLRLQLDTHPKGLTSVSQAGRHRSDQAFSSLQLFFPQ